MHSRRAYLVLIAALVGAMAANVAAALIFHHAGLPTGLWDLHFWAVWPGGHAPSWMPVNDSWMPMRKAFEWLGARHAETLYQGVFFHQHVKFQYPPTSLLLFELPQALHIAVTDRELNAIGWMAVVVEAGATAALAYVAAGKMEIIRHAPLRLALAVTIGLAVFSFHSVMWAFSLGQIQAWLNAAFALAALAFATGRHRTAGVLLGLVCLIKPQFGLFAIWAALRRKWTLLSGVLVTVGVGLVVSLMAFGWSNHVDYLSAITFMNRHGEAYYPNSSVNGILNRWLANDDPFVVDKTAFPPFNPVIYYVSLISSLGLVGWVLARRRIRGGDLNDFLAAAIVFTIASPIAWTHHLGILPPAFAVLAVGLLTAPRPARAALVLFVAYLASAVFIPPLAFAKSGLASVIYALPLLGALIVVGMLAVRSPAAERFGERM